MKLNRRGVLEQLKDVRAFDKYAKCGCMRYAHDGAEAYVQWKDRRVSCFEEEQLVLENNRIRSGQNGSRQQLHSVHSVYESAPSH